MKQLCIGLGDVARFALRGVKDINLTFAIFLLELANRDY